MADRMLMETGDQLDARGFAVRDTTLEAGRVIPLHWHDYLEWELVTEGEIMDAINRPLGAKSLDGVKRRT